MSSIHKTLSVVSMEKLKGYVYALEGLRHAWENYDALEEKAKFIVPRHKPNLIKPGSEILLAPKLSSTAYTLKAFLISIKI